jgi:cytoskeleton protein RodZ
MFKIGQSLQDARLAQGLDLADVEQQTMIRRKYLAALESERFDVLPGEAYARSFLREYADFLGLDPKPFLDQLAVQHGVDEPLPFLPPPLPRRRVGGRRLLALATVAGLVTISLLAWKLGGGSNPRLPSPRPQPAAAPRPGAPVHRATPVRPAPRPAGPHLVLTAARGPVWLLVRRGSADGPMVYENILQPGGSLRFGRRALWIRIGAPANLDVRVDGRPRPVPPSSRPENILVPARGSLRPA